jgi:hypothetical protein
MDNIQELNKIKDESCVDSVVKNILNKFIKRAEFGKNKYGTDLDREDLSVIEWINHAQEEAMDNILYLEKLKQELLKKS